MTTPKQVIVETMRKDWWDFTQTSHEICADWILGALSEAGYKIEKINRCPVCGMEYETCEHIALMIGKTL